MVVALRIAGQPRVWIAVTHEQAMTRHVGHPRARKRTLPWVTTCAAMICRRDTLASLPKGAASGCNSGNANSSPDVTVRFMSRIQEYDKSLRFSS